MSKINVIREAWGEHYNTHCLYIDGNGWLNFKALYGDSHSTEQFKEMDFEIMDVWDPKYCYYKRPVALKNLEHNNGWIDITESVPKCPVFCITCVYLFGKMQTIGTACERSPEEMKKLREKSQATHYKIIDVNPPLY